MTTLDAVTCNNCDGIQLLPAGTERCPMCGLTGTLRWTSSNPEQQEVETIQP